MHRTPNAGTSRCCPERVLLRFEREKAPQQKRSKLEPSQAFRLTPG